jgi:hypothetical protein
MSNDGILILAGIGMSYRGTVMETKEEILVRILTCLTDIEEDILTEGFDDLNDWIGDIQNKIERVKAILESEEDDNESV